MARGALAGMKMEVTSVVSHAKQRSLYRVLKRFLDAPLHSMPGASRSGIARKIEKRGPTGGLNWVVRQGAPVFRLHCKAASKFGLSRKGDYAR
jgi:hypothetical protein